MSLHDQTPHQLRQIELINEFERQAQTNSLTTSVVTPVEDFVNDPRIALTSVHFPKKELVEELEKIIDELKKIDNSIFYYGHDSLHTTIKNIKVVRDPPSFSQEDIEKVQKLFTNIVSKHHTYTVYLYRLLLFPTSLAIIGTASIELDELVVDLDQGLNSIGIPDDKHYLDREHYFSHFTLARFSKSPSQEFKKKVIELSQKIEIKPYVVDTISLVTCNAVMRKLHVVDNYSLLY